MSADSIFAHSQSLGFAKTRKTDDFAKGRENGLRKGGLKSLAFKALDSANLRKVVRTPCETDAKNNAKNEGENGVCAKKFAPPEWSALGFQIHHPGNGTPGELVQHHSGRYALERRDGILLTISQEWAEGVIQKWTQ